MHPLTGQMLCLLQSPQGFYTLLVPCLIIVDQRLLLASSLVSCGARLGLCFCLYHRQVRCQLLSWFITFQFIQPHLDSTLLHHQIISIWNLSIRVFLIFRLALEQLLMPIWHRAAYFSYKNYSCQYSCLSTVLQWWSDCSIRTAQTTY